MKALFEKISYAIFLLKKKWHYKRSKKQNKNYDPFIY